MGQSGLLSLEPSSRGPQKKAFGKEYSLFSSFVSDVDCGNFRYYVAALTD